MKTPLILSKVLLISFLLLNMSCNKNTDGLLEWNYNVVVKNVVTNEVVPNVRLQLFQHLGGQAIIDDVEVVTDINGEAVITNQINEDSLNILSEDLMLGLDLIWQRLLVSSSNYALQQIEQNDDVLPPYRTVIETDQLITIYVWESGQLDLTFDDQLNPNLYDDVSLKIRSSYADKVFVQNIGNPNSQSSYWQIKVPSDREVRLYWEVYEGIDFLNKSFAFADSDVINVAFNETIEYTIVH